MPIKKGEKYLQILEAAVKEFAENGYHKTQVSRIAKEAGVADGTIYLYFESKEDILISLFTEKMGDFVAALRNKLEASKGFCEQLKTLVYHHLEMLGANPAQAMVTQIELRQIDPKINQGISAPLKSYFNVIEEVIRLGQQEGQVSKDLDVRLARKLVFGAIDEVVTCWVMTTKKYELISLAEPLYAMLKAALVKNK
ncbi:MAG TPA: TetR/AcrR family transcriptional regulator [Clostridia bacterium]|nr:TetR/AcrR family transcriptional regulator [Clostridia bacterium]